MFKKLSSMFVIVFLFTITILAFGSGCMSKDIVMTKERGFLWASGLYEGQYNLYLDQVLKPNLTIVARVLIKENPRFLTQDMVRTDFTEAEAKELNAKKAIFLLVHNPLIVWGTYLKTGLFEPGEQFKTVAALEEFVVNHLTKLLEKEVE